MLKNSTGNYKIRAGQAAFILPGEHRSIKTCRNTDGIQYLIQAEDSCLTCINRNWMEEAIRKLPAEKRASHTIGPELYPVLQSKLSQLDKTNIHPQLLKLLKESLFLDLYTDLVMEKHDSKSVPLWLRKACKAMEQDKNLRRGPGCFYELAGKSPEHCIRQLRKHFGLTPTMFINTLRVEKAAQLLKESDSAVLDISYSLGFENPSYFSQLFRKRYGTSPIQYRAGYRL